MIGLKRGYVKLTPYTEEWKKIYIQEEKKILSLIKEYVVDIQHVGSTSITGLDAKPIIDIIIGVENFNKLPYVISRLQNTEYIYRPKASTDERVLFIKGNEDTRTHHIHIVEWNGKEWNSLINFRDYLIKHRDEALEYSKLKKKLAKKYSEDRNSYTESKNHFIKSIIEKANKEFS